MAVRGGQLRGDLENLVLSFLERGPAQGWDNARRLEQQAPHELPLEKGTLYPAPYRLENPSFPYQFKSDSKASYGSTRHCGGIGPRTNAGRRPSGAPTADAQLLCSLRR